MIYPMMAKIGFEDVISGGKTPKPAASTLFIKYVIEHLTIFATATFFLGYLFKPFTVGKEILR